jgi:hypothetical protein
VGLRYLYDYVWGGGLGETACWYDRLVRNGGKREEGVASGLGIGIGVGVGGGATGRGREWG